MKKAYGGLSRIETVEPADLALDHAIKKLACIDDGIVAVSKREAIGAVRARLRAAVGLGAHGFARAGAAALVVEIDGLLADLDLMRPYDPAWAPTVARIRSIVGHIADLEPTGVRFVQAA